VIFMTRKMHFPVKVAKPTSGEQVISNSSRYTLTDAEEVTYSKGCRDGAIIERS
jgi:hypothetical protein